MISDKGKERIAITLMFIFFVFLLNIMHKKKNLPSKICPVCNRPFSWRKKWERNWEEVRYCSKKCRSSKATLTKEPSASPNTRRP